MAIKDLTRLGRRHAALGTNQQLLIELALQRGQLLAQRGLRDVQHLGRLRQATDIHDFYVIL